MIKTTKTIFTKDHEFIVEQLRTARVGVGLSQRKVAELLGKTQSYVSKIESGQRRLDIVQLKGFAETYKKPLDYFVK